MKKITLFSAIASIFVATLAACGGGGGTSDVSNEPTSEFDGTGPAMAGELVRFRVNSSRTNYEYEILQSEFGLTGVKRTGTLTDNGDGTYTPSGDPSINLLFFDNGLALVFSPSGITRF